MREMAILGQQAKSILTPVSGFLAEAGYTHSLNPARNCTFGCLYCYVPTMRVQGGLRREDWERWGQFTTVKENAAELLRRELRAGQRIYCSPLVDPYQPAEAEARQMPGVWDALASGPEVVTVLQTRGPLVLRDVERLQALGPRVRVGVSVTTDNDRVRRAYEPHCAPLEERLRVMRALREAGVRVHATLAPLLPCHPERLAELVLQATDGDVICDPLHVRAVKRTGATTREAAWELGRRLGHGPWFEPGFQKEAVERIRRVVEGVGRRFGVGPEGFGWLAMR